eukprot:TRINITY_DN1801_c2_g1_i1.p1 TRINITY_DN1801_c2_g1~~TRINITY_DN1801_c2_g1_i1.p1  ORF type:complete len:119 (-),score=1.11 TRINITY_DN1801_c2_g1_i1:85-420(-)
MTFKRRNGGRNKHGRGHVNFRFCNNCGRSVPKDKAIKRFQVRNVIDASSERDVRMASALEEYTIPKLYVKQEYCVSCAIHRRIVRVRSHEGRRERVNPRILARQAQQARRQ